MGIIEVLNRGFGMIAGALTSLLIPILQIPMAYYLFAKNMRAINPKQNWLITISMTLTMGSIAAFISTGLALLFTGFSLFYGMKIGINEGLQGAVLLPYNIFGKMNNSIAEDSPSPATWRTSPAIYMLSTVFQFIALGCFSFIEVFVKPILLNPEERRRGELNRQHDELQQLQQIAEQQQLIFARIQPLKNPAEIKARNEKLLTSFEPPQELKNTNVVLLTEEEIKQCKKKIEEITDEKERAKRNQELTNYLDATQCPITQSPIDDPVTVVEKGASRVYENHALREWIEEKNKTFVDASEPLSRTALASLTIYNGYPEFVTEFISYAQKLLKPEPKVETEEEKKQQARLKLFDPKYENPKPASDSTPSTSPTVSTMKPGGTDQSSGNK